MTSPVASATACVTTWATPWRASSPRRLAALIAPPPPTPRARPAAPGRPRAPRPPAAQPLRDAPDGEAHDRTAMRHRFETHDPEGLGPERGDRDNRRLVVAAGHAVTVARPEERDGL